MYSLAGYGSMITDRVRMDAFARALRDVITPESVVVDIGTGTGILALLACRFGARRVYAIEPDDAIQVAREIAAANGYADRIDFIQAVSTKVTLPEQANVIVSDIGGMLPLFERHIPSIVDARRRFLAPGGVLIPQRDTTWAAVVEASDLFDSYIAPWDDRFGFNMAAARTRVMNTLRRGNSLRTSCWQNPRTGQCSTTRSSRSPMCGLRCPGVSRARARAMDLSLASNVSWERGRGSRILRSRLVPFGPNTSTEPPSFRGLSRCCSRPGIQSPSICRPGWSTGTTCGAGIPRHGLWRAEPVPSVV